MRTAIDDDGMNNGNAQRYRSSGVPERQEFSQAPGSSPASRSPGPAGASRSPGNSQDRRDRQDRQERVMHRPINGSGPQPIIQGTPAEVVYDDDTVKPASAQPQPQVQPVENALGGTRGKAAEAKPARRAPREPQTSPPPSACTEKKMVLKQATPDTANDLSPAGIVAEVKKRRDSGRIRRLI